MKTIKGSLLLYDRTRPQLKIQRKVLNLKACQALYVRFPSGKKSNDSPILISIQTSSRKFYCNLSQVMATAYNALAKIYVINVS
ncbi:CLUMA_CG017479, isoform A [Clunio marinus]|uniref:CLUMA_CG017479, isoform A n=1 Tax=Clunio marinus TaxID=568069 RepID=A0A1J1IXU3_9DIPT|nr:CLUMA_CG017479, isoform A [Clunio marinus]